MIITNMDLVQELKFNKGRMKNMTKEKSDEKNIHSGHRMRVINSYNNIDFDVLAPHQVLEYILFYVFPRGDTNPLAHRLLKKFGSVQNVLDASVSELKTVYGINERSAQLILGFTKIFDYYTTSKLSRKFFFGSYNDISDYCEELLRFANNEVFYAVAVDPSFHVIGKRVLGEGSVDLVSFDIRKVCDFITETRAANLLLVHNHPGGLCTPSENDVKGTEIIANLVKIIGVNFIDHIIVGCDGVYSVNENRKIKEFADNEQIKETAKEIKLNKNG